VKAANQPRRGRRSADEIRALMLEAGRAVFAELGYAGASTKEIARRADVGEVLLFRHFQNKAGLFDEAVLAPLESFVDQWAGLWEQHGLRGATIDELAEDYVRLLYGFFESNRELVTALLSARAHHPEASARLDELFSRLEATVREGMTEYNLPVGDPVLTVRLTFGLVLSTVVNADLLFAGDDRITRDRVVAEVTRFMLHGVAHRDATAEI